MQSVKIKGTGFFTKKKIALTLTQDGNEIVFIRKDKKDFKIKASLENSFVKNHTVGLKNEKYSIVMVEHLLGAIFLSGTGGFVIEVDGPEIPFLDGSGMEFYEALKEFDQRNPQWFLLPKKFFVLSDGVLIGIPSPQLSVHYLFLLNGRPLYAEYKNGMEERVAKARTFGKGKFDSLEHLCLSYRRSKEYVYSFPLYYPQEFAYHKILDFLGDLMLLGKRIKGNFFIGFSGHLTTHKFLKELKREWL